MVNQQIQNQYKVCKTILHEVIDDEVIALDMDSGSYYSLRSTAASIWSFIDQGISSDKIIQHIANNNKVDEKQVTDEATEFLCALKDAGLIEACSNGAVASTTPELSTHVVDYTTPKLETFTDIQDLLMIDPIHDVDEMGWPMPKQGQ